MYLRQNYTNVKVTTLANFFKLFRNALKTIDTELNPRNFISHTYIPFYITTNFYHLTAPQSGVKYNKLI